MATLRGIEDIIKGSALMLFFREKGATGAAQPVGFATEHNISVDLQLTEIQTKDDGDGVSQLPQRVTWSGSASNLYSDQGEGFYLDLISKKKVVEVTFAKATEYDPAGYGEGEVEGIVDVDGAADWTVGETVATGYAYVNNVSINAPADGPATLSIQLTGKGTLTIPTT